MPESAAQMTTVSEIFMGSGPFRKIVLIALDAQGGSNAGLPFLDSIDGEQQHQDVQGKVVTDEEQQPDFEDDHDQK